MCAAPGANHDIGVARPRAQGLTMISTATVLTSASPIAGGGPQVDHTMRANAPITITAGTNHAESVWRGAESARERCASATM